MIRNNRNPGFQALNLHDKQSFYDALYTLLEPYAQRLTKEKTKKTTALGITAAHYDDKAAELEALARPLWGLSGACKHADDPRFEALSVALCSAIEAGLTEGDPDYWGSSSGVRTQRYVEMAPLVLAFRVSARAFWDPLPHATKQAAFTWFKTINVSEESVADNNWRFFRILVNTFLKKAGATYSSAMLEKDFAAIEGYYVGEGWYTDGQTEQTDHYIGFAMHFYALLYTELQPDDEARCARYKDRARLFARDFVAWFAANGAALAFGRSLTYRFAHAAFWVGYVCARIYEMPQAPVTLQEAKGLIVRNIAYWLRSPIFDNAGFLSVGYGYPNVNMAEEYNAPGSPYWALKAFYILSLPRTHEFWSAEAAPLPVEKENRVQSHARFTISRAENGTIMALAAGGYAAFEPRHHKEKYAKFAYAPHCGFTVSVSNEGLRHFSVDNTLACSVDGVHWSHKGKNSACAVHAEYMYAQWAVPHVNVRVHTVLVPISASWHLRVHSIVPEAKHVSVQLAEGGFSTPYDYCGVRASLEVLSGDIKTYCDELVMHSQLSNLQTPFKKNTSAFFRTEYEGSVFYSGICEITNACTAHIKTDFPNANVLAPRSVTPLLRSSVEGEKTVRATLVYCACVQDNRAMPLDIPDVAVEDAGHAVYVDGKEIIIEEKF